MNDIESIRPELIKFKSSDKFVDYGYLQPAVEASDEDARRFVNNEMSRCCDEMLAYLDTNSPVDTELKQIGRNCLERIEDEMLETEDKEFCYQLLNVLGHIIGVDLEDHSIDLGDKLLADMERILKKAGLSIKDFTNPNNPDKDAR